jgi:hypothetical protein
MRFKRFIKEGVFDPGIFTAIFLAGGPGSGKSYVAGKTTTGYGLKLVNSDTTLERLLKKHNVPLDFSSLSPGDTLKKDELRVKARAMTFGKMKVKGYKGTSALDLYLHGRLGIVVDGTGKEFDDIKEQSDIFRQLGYSTFMIFVNTSLKVAQIRNAERPRKLKPEMVEQLWTDVQSNMGKFQSYFGASNFILIDNNNAKENVFRKVSKQTSHFVKMAPSSRIAQDWIANEMEKRVRK